MDGNLSPSHPLEVSVLRLGAPGSDEDKTFWICHMISQNHVIKCSSYFVSRTLSQKVIILPSLMAIGILIVKI